MTFHFSKKYFLLTIIVFVTEVLIALFADDKLIRPFAGDALVVVLIYCFLRMFLNLDYVKIAVGVLFFAFVIETLQYFDYVKLLGVENNKILSVALGRTFEWLDFAAYFAGFLLIIMCEKFYERYKIN
jgi:hypothetical protein